ncbi:MAG: tRNA lysidine(34) synthetase TilS [Geobacter sp.]|nr:tRNA lysidine(34) synthetase TilS [Geobacter sp.]
MPASTLPASFVRTILEQKLFQPDETLIVALSGGADSTALLDLLARLPEYHPRLVAVHLNHCLRGDESDQDEEFCRKLAADYGIIFESRRVDVKALALSERLNLEDAGRRARIELLDEVREKYGAATIVTAHHADDQAETVLMRLLRGSGMPGLSGIPYRNRRGYIRPLLDVSRSQIEEYLAERGLSWREDASNRDTSFLRNRIRHELLPLLEQYNPAIRQRLTATAAVLSEENACLDGLAEQVFQSLCHHDGVTVVCSIAGLKAHPVAIQRRILRHACRKLTGNLDGFGLEHIDSVLRLLDSPRPNSRVSLPQKVSAIREYDRLLFRFGTELIPDDIENTIISFSGLYPLPWGGSLEVAACSSLHDLDNQPADSVIFDLGKTPFPWQVRRFRPGDRMVPFGMTGRKKVKDIFIDRKIALTDRKRIPLLFCGDDLVWIPTVCSSELCRIDKTPESMVLVTWHS